MSFALLAARTMAKDEIFSLDGHGKPVAWWVVIKIPWEVRNAHGQYVRPPCDCPKPECENVGVQVEEERKFGLCYLYADANQPQLKYFRDMGYDCLGQGGLDPVSQTLRQRENATYWAYFNDQLNGIALQVNKSQVCSGANDFNAHSKGALAFNANTGGFVLQSSTPNFPDPSPVAKGEFVRLGCQHDNNVEYAQHMFSMSLGSDAMHTLGKGWQAARLCSANHYHAIRDLLVSKSFFTNLSSSSSAVQSMAAALTHPHLPLQESLHVTLVSKAVVVTDELHAPQGAAYKRNSIFTPSSSSSSFHALFKSKRAAVPPWALAAQTFQSDLSVASWWDENYGVPSICDGDNFTRSRDLFCLDQPSHGLSLRSDGTFPYNVENLMDAT